MRVLRSIAVTFAVFFLALSAFPAQAEETKFARYDKALGFYASEFTGPGLSYQQWLGRTGYQVSAGILYLDDELDYHVSAGITRMLADSDIARGLSAALYAVGTGFHRGETVWDNHLDDPENGGEEFVARVGAGVGVGSEVLILDRFSWTVEFQYVYQQRLDPSELEGITPEFSTGLRFRF